MTHQRPQGTSVHVCLSRSSGVLYRSSNADYAGESSPLGRDVRLERVPLLLRWSGERPNNHDLVQVTSQTEAAPRAGDKGLC